MQLQIDCQWQPGLLTAGSEGNGEATGCRLPVQSRIGAERREAGAMGLLCRQQEPPSLLPAGPGPPGDVQRTKNPLESRTARGLCQHLCSSRARCVFFFSSLTARKMFEPRYFMPCLVLFVHLQIWRAGRGSRRASELVS